MTYGKYASLLPKVRKTHDVQCLAHGNYVPSMVRLELVPQWKLAEAEVLIKCAHGNHFKYPLADVCIEVGVRGL